MQTPENMAKLRMAEEFSRSSMEDLRCFMDRRDHRFSEEEALENRRLINHQQRMAMRYQLAFEVVSS